MMRVQGFLLPIFATATSIFLALSLAQPTPASAGGINAPGAPLSVSALASGNSIDVSWTPPTTGAVVDGYEIDWKRADVLESTWSYDFAPNTDTSYRITNLAAGLYEIQVAAYAAGCSSGIDCYSDSTAAPEAVNLTNPESPSNLVAGVVGDNVTLSWAESSSSRQFLRYEARVELGWMDPTIAATDNTYFLGGNFETTSTTIRIEHLLPSSGWSFAVRAVYSDGESGWINYAQNFEIGRPVATLRSNFQRIYSSVRDTISPTITGVPDSYSIVYRSDNRILSTSRLDSIGGRDITWTTISQCAVADTNIVIDVIYLSETELQSTSSGCGANKLTSDLDHYSDRKVGTASFEFMVSPIPIAEVTFYGTQSTTSNSRVDKFWDNEPITWPAKPNVGERNPETGAKFLGWSDSEDSSILVNTSSTRPIPNHVYFSKWQPMVDPTIPFSISIGSLKFEDLESQSTSEDRHIVISADDLQDGKLLLDLKLRNGISWRSALSAVDARGGILQDEFDQIYVFENARTGSGTWEMNVSDLEGRVLGPVPLLRFELHTVDASGLSNDFYFYIILAAPGQPVGLTVSTPDSSNSQLLTDGESSSWVQIEAPLFEPSGYEWPLFVGWCDISDPNSESDCWLIGDYVPVNEDLDLYEVWVEAPLPAQISIGDRNFQREDFEFDSRNNVIYLTAEVTEGNPPLAGDIIIAGARSSVARYESEEADVEKWNGDRFEKSFVSDSNFTWNFTPNCFSGPDCSEIYTVSDMLLIAGGQEQESFTLKILVSPDVNNTFDVVYDNGNTTEMVSRSFGWHQVPDGESVNKRGYFTHGDWHSNYDSPEYYDPEYYDGFFPVVADQTLSLMWHAGPRILIPSVININFGASRVATPHLDVDSAVTWRLEGTTDFEISATGEISAAPTLSVGSYSFTVSAQENYVLPAQVTVNVIQETQSQSPAGGQSPPQGGSGVNHQVDENVAQTEQDEKAKILLQLLRLKKGVTIYSIGSPFKLNPAHAKQLVADAKVMPKGTLVLCSGYLEKSKSVSYSRARSLALSQAKALCATLKKTNKSVITKISVFPYSKAPRQAVNKKWEPITYRIVKMPKNNL